MFQFKEQEKVHLNEIMKKEQKIDKRNQSFYFENYFLLPMLNKIMIIKTELR